MYGRCGRGLRCVHLRRQFEIPKVHRRRFRNLTDVVANGRLHVLLVLVGHVLFGVGVRISTSAGSATPPLSTVQHQRTGGEYQRHYGHPRYDCDQRQLDGVRSRVFTDDLLAGVVGFQGGDTRRSLYVCGGGEGGVVNAGGGAIRNAGRGL